MRIIEIAERIIWGKKFRGFEDAKKIRVLKFMNVLFLFEFVALIGLVAMLLSIHFSTANIVGLDDRAITLKAANLKIVYDDLTDEEIENARGLIREVKDNYLLLIDQITFTNDISKYCGKDSLGCNKGHTKVYIGYHSSEEELRDTICHELVHSFLIYPLRDGRSDSVHSIVYDIGETEVCFEDGPTRNIVFT